MSASFSVRPPNVYCKIVNQEEHDVLVRLQPQNLTKHHIAHLLHPPYPLPLSKWILIMLFLGTRPHPCNIGPPDDMLTRTRQLCEAVIFLHTNCVTHMDIKFDNIVVSHPPKYRVTLLDLGPVACTGPLEPWFRQA
ncbi:hypothetical protein B0H17DRAFT_1078559 [Mycena rosella]|uniref:Protein kinase domain-containing protein n=1 Tax=Mycena rosella TaxID=1033263 RepID=A0AAD7G8U5_MYCRO|nr:hypothetical protein B0H17DRAFT_1078559 [Mycena rosella]